MQLADVTDVGAGPRTPRGPRASPKTVSGAGRGRGVDQVDDPRERTLRVVAEQHRAPCRVGPPSQQGSRPGQVRQPAQQRWRGWCCNIDVRPYARLHSTAQACTQRRSTGEGSGPARAPRQSTSSKRRWRNPRSPAARPDVDVAVAGRLVEPVADSRTSQPNVHRTVALREMNTGVTAYGSGWWPCSSARRSRVTAPVWTRSSAQRRQRLRDGQWSCSSKVSSGFLAFLPRSGTPLGRDKETVLGWPYDGKQNRLL